MTDKQTKWLKGEINNLMLSVAEMANIDGMNATYYQGKKAGLNDVLVIFDCMPSADDLEKEEASDGQAG